MTAALRVTWSLEGRGWASCTLEDHQGRVALIASYITPAPEDLVSAVARLLAGEDESRVQFEAEPTAYRWILSREAELVRARVLELRDARHHDDTGTEIWLGRLSLDDLARAVVRCFDDVARTYGESGYRETWGRPFPDTELEALRSLWRSWQLSA